MNPGYCWWLYYSFGVINVSISKFSTLSRCNNMVGDFLNSNFNRQPFCYMNFCTIYRQNKAGGHIWYSFFIFWDPWTLCGVKLILIHTTLTIFKINKTYKIKWDFVQSYIWKNTTDNKAFLCYICIDMISTKNISINVSKVIPKEFIIS